MRGRLTPNQINALRKPGRYGDGDTLFLVVAPRGSKSWVQRLTIHGRRHDIGLGGYPLVTLAEARDTALANRRLARKGGDPLSRKHTANVPTFRDAAAATYEANQSGWRSDKVAKNWRQRLERHVLPKLGQVPVNCVGREEVLRVLVPLGTTETGRKVKTIIRQTIGWAVANGYVEGNVVDAVKGALPKQAATTNHHRALPHAKVAASLHVIEASAASLAAKSCLRFVVLTAARSGQARGATWEEINVDDRVWTISASRMKAATPHRVPLPDAALAVLEAVSPLSGDEGFVFPSPSRPAKPLSDMTLTKVLRDNGLAERCTVDGFRRSFREWCADTGKPKEIAEAALAHIVRGEGAYARSDDLDRRRVVMDAWAGDVCNPHGS
ncbi:MAG: integrase arm-type DNA-binding domain-containing protein [Gammaproteobacteria bacterium]|nr:integrase arm-type DNA-binding domain-containing protein [Gammaproteobacteria bacterium]